MQQRRIRFQYRYPVLGRSDDLSSMRFICSWRIMRTQGAALDRVDIQALAPAVYCTGRRPAAGRDERRSGPVRGPSGPRSVSVMGGSRRRRGLDHGGLADSEGSPGPVPVCGPPGGPNQGRVGGARKAESEKRSKREARAYAFLLCDFCRLFSLKGRTSVAGK